MAEAIRRAKVAVALVFAPMALYAGIVASSPQSAAAYTVSNYCNNITLGGGGSCEGEPRNQYAVEGWGDQHAVCVFVQTTAEIGRRCSGGPGEHVYDPIGFEIYGKPGIQNVGGTNSTVHGRSYQP